MNDALTTPTAPRQDAVALRRARSRIEQRAESPWLHREVARRMAQRVGLFKQPPSTVLDWGSRLGGSAAVLRDACPQAHLVAVEPAPAEAGTRPWWSPGRWLAAPSNAIAEAAVEPGSAQMVWCNMGLHHDPAPPSAMARWHRALAIDGMLLFSTVGPGTLAELRALYARCGWPSPHAPFVDMHDIGDMLVQAGFADPVMDQEALTLTWSDVETMLAELRGLGGNTDRDRFAGLRTPGWRRRLIDELQRTAAAGRIAASFEIVYGHAVKPRPRAPVRASTAIDLAQMRAMVGASGRRPGGGGGSLR